MKKSFVLILALSALVLSCSGGGMAAGDISDITDGRPVSQSGIGSVTLQPGEEKVISEVKGAGALKYFYFTDNRGGIKSEAVVLRIYWDGNEFPSVNVPVSDFFGAVGCRYKEFAGKYLAIHHNCYQCYFPMPFSKGAKVTLYNDSDAVYEGSGCAWGFDYEMDRSYRRDKSRFHAYYHRSNPTVDGLHTFLDIKGRGTYVGNVLHVYTTNNFWWGEGDTVFTVDGESYRHTPGTEDEHGSCYESGRNYCLPEFGYIEGGRFEKGMPDDRGYRGHNAYYRFYDSAPVRFRKSFKHTLQNLCVGYGKQYDADNLDPAGDDYTTVAFYYLDKAAATELQPYAERTAPTKAVNHDIIPDWAIEKYGASSFLYNGPVPERVFENMKGRSYKDNCTVPIEDLRFLNVLCRDADGNATLGEMVCNKSIADDLAEIFKSLFEAGYPIQRMRLIDGYDADDVASMLDNNSSCFNFRKIAGSSSLSRHSLGMAVDINPFYNPYCKNLPDGKLFVSPEQAAKYADRSVESPYRIVKGDLCWKLFIEHGFEWGGDWNSCKDYQHFEK